MRRIAALASSLIVVLSVSAAAAPSTPEATPFAGPPEVPGGPPPAFADGDGDGLPDDFQAKLAPARPGDRFDVIVSSSGPGDARSTRQAVGPFRLRREFNIIGGFAATMTAAQIQGLAGSPGVGRIEEDFEVRAYLESVRPDFGVDGAVDLFGYTGKGVGICVVDAGIDDGHERLDNGKVVGWLDVINGHPDPYDDHGPGTPFMIGGDARGGPVQPLPAQGGPAPGTTLCVRGRLTGEGVECPTLRAKDGALYTLAGNLNDFQVGEEVCVCGTIAAVSICMQGTTIAVARVGPAGACP